MNLDAGDGRILVAQRSNTTIRQWSSLANEHVGSLDRRPHFKISLQRPPSRKRKRNGSLLSTFAIAEYRRSASFVQNQIIEFKANQIANSAAGVEH